MSNIVCKSVRLCSVCRSDEHDKRKCDMCAMDMRYFVSKNDIRSLCVKSLKLKTPSSEYNKVDIMDLTQVFPLLG